MVVVLFENAPERGEIGFENENESLRSNCLRGGKRARKSEMEMALLFQGSGKRDGLFWEVRF